MIATITKTKDALPMGKYTPTTVDVYKSSAEFRLVAVGNKNTIIWKNGTTEHVTDAKLDRLQALHTWACDF